jgi:hypothetical protein
MAKIPPNLIKTIKLDSNSANFKLDKLKEMDNIYMSLPSHFRAKIKKEL